MDILPIIKLLNEANDCVDILTTNGDEVLGMNANFFLAALTNNGCKVRYIQSKHENVDNNPTVDDILFSFGSNAIKAFIYNYTEYSCVIIDNKIGFSLENTLTTSPESILNLQADVNKLQSDFNAIWDNNYPQKKIKAVCDVIDTLTYLDFKRGDILFRGQCNHEWEATPTIFRDVTIDIKEFEVEALKSIFTRNNNKYLNNFDPLNYFVVNQHYGTPTRLLDLTRDALIGLFFACHDPADNFGNKDGKLYLLERAQYASIDFNGKHLEVFKEIPNKESVPYYLGRVHFREPVLFEPIIKNPRMRYQEGIFILLPYIQDSITYSSIEGYNRYRNKEVTDEDKKYWTACKLVDKQFKKSILKELKDSYGICQETIFPKTMLD